MLAMEQKVRGFLWFGLNWLSFSVLVSLTPVMF